MSIYMVITIAGILSVFVPLKISQAFRKNGNDVLSVMFLVN